MQKQNALKVNLAFQVARRLIRRRVAETGVNDAETVDWPSYYRWRYKALEAGFRENFAVDSVAGKDVLDFGCGDGSLSMVIADLGARSVHGVDLDASGLAGFAERLKHHTGPCLPTYGQSSSGTMIDAPDRSFDSAFCFDVMEHIIDYRDIILEWRRVLRPGGNVFIVWQPYWHPFGHHAHHWIPIPWAHVFLNDEEFREVCARIVDCEEFEPAVWDKNADGSRKNRFRVPNAGSDFLNKLTVNTFERLCSDAGFKVARREFRPLSVPQPLKAVSALATKLPRARDFFTACAIYELVSP